MISFYSGKTIHTFTSSGTFANPTALNGGNAYPNNTPTDTNGDSGIVIIAYPS